MNTEHIFTQFRQANPEYRLSLFLQYRDLRSYFQEIEKEELQPENTKQQIIFETRRVKPPLSRIVRWCYTLFS